MKHLYLLLTYIFVYLKIIIDNKIQLTQLAIFLLKNCWTSYFHRHPSNPLIHNSPFINTRVFAGVGNINSISSLKLTSYYSDNNKVGTILWQYYCVAVCGRYLTTDFKTCHIKNFSCRERIPNSSVQDFILFLLICKISICSFTHKICKF